MIEVSHAPTSHDTNSYTIVGDSINELIEECLKRIRPQSKEFYKKELRKDLESKNKSLIDRHAGMGVFYKVIME